MLINSIKLNNYRNYSKYFLNLDPKLNIIVGDNGIGKTNILESIVLVSNTKSFRTNIDQNLIKHNEEYLKVELDTDIGNFKVVINNKNKALYFNNELINKTSKFIGLLPSILFIPSDLEIFIETPSERRKLIDVEIVKVSNNYLFSLLKYNSLLKDKNKLLKENNINNTLLDVIEESMIPHIQVIMKERMKFFDCINKNISAIYNKIADANDQIKIVYKNSMNLNNLKNDFKNNHEKDLNYHYSFIGPHHDDYYFKLNDKNLNDIASQGQKRMVMIAFKFSLIRYIHNMSSKIPIILLDDILSELDKSNQERLLKILPSDAQIIITDTNINNLKITKNYKLIDLMEERYV